MLDHAWNLFVDDIGGDIILSDILDQSACASSVANGQCSTTAPSDYNLCNMTWHNMTMAKYCGDGFATATLGDLAASQRWPREDPEVGLGMEKLWYAAENMQLHQPSPFYMFIANNMNGTDGFSIPHEALYARNYATFAEKAGVNFTVYYTDYIHMKTTDVGMERIMSDRWGKSTLWNYRSSHHWRSHTGVKDVALNSDEEKVLFACMAVGMDCTTERAATIMV